MEERTVSLVLGLMVVTMGWSGCRSSPSPEALFAEAEDLRLSYHGTASQQAIMKYREAMTAWQDSGNVRDAARALQAIGATYEQLGRLKESLAEYGAALSLSQRSTDRRLESLIRSDLGVAHARLGEFDLGLSQCRAAQDMGRESGGVREEARAQNCLGDVDYHRGDSDRALPSYRAAEGLWRRLGDRRGLADTFLLLGATQTDVGKLDSAGQYLRDALSLYRELRDPRGQALTDIALARLQFIPGEYQEALNRYAGLRERFRTAGDAVWEAASLSSSAYVYEQMGDSRSALNDREEASGLFETAGLQMAALEMFVKVGIGYLARDGNAALSWFEKARALSQSSGNQHMHSWALRYIGVAHLARGDLTRALDSLEQSLVMQRSLEDPRFRVGTLIDVGRAHTQSGDPGRAMRYFKDALELSRACRDRVGEAHAYYGQARVLAGLSQLHSARSYVERALVIAESLRTEVESRDLRASYVASVHQYHELHVDVLMRLAKVRPKGGLAAAAFAAAEQARARSLLDSLAEAKVDLRAGVSPDLLQREQTAKKAFNDWASRRARVMKTNTREAAALADEYRDLEARYTQIQAEIRSKSPRYAALAKPQPLSLKDVQQQVLDADTLLLEYALGEERSYLWAVSNKDYASYELPPRATIEQAAQGVYAHLTVRLTTTGDTADRRHQVEQADAEYWREAARLSAMLLGPVAKKLAGKRLLVVTDGALQYLPFTALPEPDGRSGPVPLVVGHEIVNLPSASVLAVLRRETRGRKSPDKVVAVLADPVFEADDPRLRAAAAVASSRARGVLRGDALSVSRLAATRQEADAVVATAPAGSALKAIDFDASRATALSPELAQYRIVHFATHGVFDNENPGLSGVILSMFDKQGQPQDGFLRLHDIYNLHLPAELVVLSACNTALGQPVRGEGLVGIVRGFMYAGAKRVVASLWKVDDEATGELMSRFYREMLTAHRSPAAALRQAQIAMWQQGRWRSPFHWGAFVLLGEWQ